MKKRYWYFKCTQGYIWEVTEVENGLELSVLIQGKRVYSITYPDWEELDRMQQEGKFKFIHEEVA